MGVCFIYILKKYFTFIGAMLNVKEIFVHYDTTVCFLGSGYYNFVLLKSFTFLREIICNKNHYTYAKLKEYV